MKLSSSSFLATTALCAASTFAAPAAFPAAVVSTHAARARGKTGRKAPPTRGNRRANRKAWPERGHRRAPANENNRLAVAVAGVSTHAFLRQLPSVVAPLVVAAYALWSYSSISCMSPASHCASSVLAAEVTCWLCGFVLFCLISMVLNILDSMCAGIKRLSGSMQGPCEPGLSSAGDSYTLIHMCAGISMRFGTWLCMFCGSALLGTGAAWHFLRG